MQKRSAHQESVLCSAISGHSQSFRLSIWWRLCVKWRQVFVIEIVTHGGGYEHEAISMAAEEVCHRSSGRDSGFSAVATFFRRSAAEAERDVPPDEPDRKNTEEGSQRRHWSYFGELRTRAPEQREYRERAGRLLPEDASIE